MPRRMRIPRAVLAMLVVAGGLAAPFSQAADSEGRSAIKGYGLMPCSRFTEARDGALKARQTGEQTRTASTYLIMGGWIEGYITALNQSSPETFDLASFESTDLLANVVDSHCRRNPEHRFADVVKALARGLVESRIQEYSELVQLDVEGRKAVLYRETVRRIQQRLVDLGHYAGAVDGDYGEGTIEAMRAFQSASTLEPTGSPDQLTLVRLFRPGDPAR